MKHMTIAAALLITLGLVGCGSDSASSSSATDTSDTSDTSDQTTTPSLPDSINLVFIPSGSFTMGDSTKMDAPEVTVNLSEFTIAATETTNAQYLEFLNAALADDWLTVSSRTLPDPCGTYTEDMVIGAGDGPHVGEIWLQLGETGGCTSDGHSEDINNKSWIDFNANNEFVLLDANKADWPINWLRWHGADAFAQYYGVSLPTEAQWEYAARGGMQLEYPTNDGTLDSTTANYNGDTPGVYNATGHAIAVGSYAPNPYGLYDMGGNVWEWCADYYANNFYTNDVTDPINTSAGTDAKRVRRGGSWNYHSDTLRTFARASDFPDRGNNHFGFRVVKN